MEKELSSDEIKMIKDRLIALQARIFESSTKIAIEINSLLFDLGMIYGRKIDAEGRDNTAIAS